VEREINAALDQLAIGGTKEIMGGFGKQKTDQQRTFWGKKAQLSTFLG
jgi:hypothetical protein